MPYLENMIELLYGDITQIKVDAIVNAANTSLLGGSGVDGAIHRIGGFKIYEECQKIRNKQGGCKVSEAVITNAGNLPCKFIIHAVGPNWRKDDKNVGMLLGATYNNCLTLAIKNNIRTIAFPNISTGIYMYPKKEAAVIAIKTVQYFLKHSNKIDKIIFVCFDVENYNIYNNILNSKNLNCDNY